MRFEARILKPYAEPVSAPDLQHGEVYFSLNYMDDDLLVPELIPLIYLGRNMEDTGEIEEDLLYFQDLDSYREGVRISDESPSRKTANFFFGAESEATHIFTFESALDCILMCSIRRKERKPTKV
jgi:hypothetical protein